MKKTLLVIALLVFASIGYSQDYPGKGKIGLGIDGITSSPNINLKYYFTDDIAGMLIAGANFDINGGDAPAGSKKVTGTDFRGGLAFMYHFTKTKVSPFIGIQGIYENVKDAGIYIEGTEPDSKSSLNAGVIFGIDYFFDKKISIGIKETVGADFQFKRDKPVEDTNTKLSTGTVLTARIYF